MSPLYPRLHLRDDNNDLNWRPIKELVSFGGRRQIWLVGRADEADPNDPNGRVPVPLIAVAYGNGLDNWTHDFDGKNPISFVPQWYAEAPCFPPWSAPEDK